MAEVETPLVNLEQLAENADVNENEGEPPGKKAKLEKEKSTAGFKLEDRLNGILCCAVCLDLPKRTVFQCSHGHLMCASCLSHLLADARLKDETPTCPNCRCEISKVLCTRNLAVEKAISELPKACRYCSEQLARNCIDVHERETCSEREVHCRYEKIGCQWCGPAHEKEGHETSCSHPKKTGEEVMEYLATAEQKRADEMHLLRDIFTLLSYERVTFSDVQLKPYRSDEFIPKLFYESARFSALTYQWVVKAFVNDNQKNPNLSAQRTIAYQLALKSRIQSQVGLYYLALNGPYDEMKVNPVIERFEFKPEVLETTLVELPLVDSVECNKQLSAKTISMRLLMFQVK